MKGLISFLGASWLWILLALVVCFFAYLGYSAEKKGYIVKKKKDNKDDDNLVDIDSIIKNGQGLVKVEEHEEDLSNSFDAMPEVKKEEAVEAATEVKEEEIQVPDELYAPFGDSEVKPVEDTASVSEVGEQQFKQDFVDVAKIEEEAKDINDKSDKKDVADLMSGSSNVDLGFDVEGSTMDVSEDNIFTKKEEEETKKEEVVDDMWKF